MKDNELEKLDEDLISGRIYSIRGFQVMLDRDLAELYGVEVRYLNRAVKRNIERFPQEFSFLLNNQEMSNLKFHFGTSSWGGKRKNSRVFTEQGVAMLSAVLRSEIAVKMSIKIMKEFIEMRRFIQSNAQLFQIIDGRDVYHVGASLKDLGKKWVGFSKFGTKAIDILGRLDEID